MQADERRGEVQESEMYIASALVANGKAAIASKPGEGSFDDPAMLPKFLAGLYALAGDATADAASLKAPATPGDVVRLVGVELQRAFAWPPRPEDRRDAVDEFFEEPRVVGVRG